MALHANTRDSQVFRRLARAVRNAHVVIEEYRDPIAAPTVLDGPALIILSARQEERLREYAQRLLRFLDTPANVAQVALADLAYTLQFGREAMDERLGIVAHSLDELREKLRAYVAGDAVIDELYRGQVKRNKEALAAFAGDDDMPTIVEAWLAKGKHGKLLDLWTKGLSFDWQRLYTADRRPRRISLPTYPFARERYWVPLGETTLATAASTAAVLHPLLHRNTSNVDGLRFSAHFSGEEFFLADHQVQGHRVLPGVAQLEMLRCAARQVFDADEALQWKHIAWLRPIRVGADGIDLQLALHAREDGDFDAEIYAQHEDSEALVYSQGVVAIDVVTPPSATRHDIAALQRQYTVAHVDAAQCYAHFESLGLRYGPTFRGLSELFIGRGNLLARIALPASLAATAAEYVLHPSVLDAALQATLYLNQQSATLMLPFALDGVDILAPCTSNMWAVVRSSDNVATDAAVQRLDIDLCDEQGVVCVRLRQLQLRAVLGGQLRAEISPATLSAGETNPTLLMRPIWTAATAQTVISDAPNKHLVLLCDLPETRVAELERRIPSAVFLTVPVTSDLAAGYSAAANTLLEQLQSLTREQGHSLVQVALPAVGASRSFAGLSGMLRTAQLEHPRIRGQVLEVESGQDVAQALLDNRDDAATRLRYVGSTRHVAAWEEFSAPATGCRSVESKWGLSDLRRCRRFGPGFCARDRQAGA